MLMMMKKKRTSHKLAASVDQKNKKTKIIDCEKFQEGKPNNSNKSISMPKTQQTNEPNRF